MEQKLPRTAPLLSPAAVVVCAGICAALHVGKLPPAITALQQALGLTLVQAGFLLALVQAAGMALGVVLGALADGLGARRSMLLGLALLAGARAAGALADGVPALMLLRALEGLGFLLVVLPAPGLLRQLVQPRHTSRMLGLWGAYMPLATALALLLGPLWLAAWGWRSWWGGLALLSLLMALWLRQAVPQRAAGADTPRTPAEPQPGSPAAARSGWAQRLRQTLASPGPWLVAVTFAMYSSQWLSVIGFLPSIVAQAGLPALALGLLTAVAAGVNALGNVAAGRLLQRGVAPVHLLWLGFVSMGLGALLAFGAAGGTGLGAMDTAGAAATASGGDGLQAGLRYLALLLFSGVGGMVPATLFLLALRLAPAEHLVSSTMGWMQQWSALGQFAGPPVVAWVASRAGGWHWTGAVTGSAALAGCLLAWALGRLLARQPGVPARR